MCWTSML
nr:unknown [Zea mays]